MKKRVLITGASGFVGYHLIEEALHNNLEVYAAVRKSSKTDHLKEFDIQYTHLNYSDVNALKKEIEEKQYNYIIHAAGVTTALSEKEYNIINAGYTSNLAKAASEPGSGIEKFVFMGSLAAIGPLNNLNGIIDESTPPCPVTAYGRSKLLAEERLKKFTNLNYTILRPTGIYGPREKGIFIILKQFVKGIEPYIGNKPQKLSFIYVKDLATVTIKSLFGGDHKAYNLSDGNFYDRYELAELTKSILGVKTIKFHLPVNFVKLIATFAEKFGYLSGKASALNVEKIKELTAINWSCSIEEAQHDLGFYPQYNLEKGLRETYNWYKVNKWL